MIYDIFIYCSWVSTRWQRSVDLYRNRKETAIYTKEGTVHKTIQKHRRHKIYFLTYSMVQSPSSEANWFAASHEIPRISRNPNVHYRTHKRPPPVSILGQPNPVHIPTSHLLDIHPNIIHSSTSRSPQWSLSLRFSHQDPIHPLVYISKFKSLMTHNFNYIQRFISYRIVNTLLFGYKLHQLMACR